MTILVPLTLGLFATIDDADAALVLDGRAWQASRVDSRRENYRAQRTIKIDGVRTSIFMYRLIISPLPTEKVDHHDGNGLNNTRINLRRCSMSQNNANIFKYRGGSRFKGVWWDRRNQRWRAAVCVDGRDIHLGRFASEEEAAAAYNAAAISVWGDFARLNEVAA